MRIASAVLPRKLQRRLRIGSGGKSPVSGRSETVSIRILHTNRQIARYLGGEFAIVEPFEAVRDEIGRCAGSLYECAISVSRCGRRIDRDQPRAEQPETRAGTGCSAVAPLRSPGRSPAPAKRRALASASASRAASGLAAGHRQALMVPGTAAQEGGEGPPVHSHSRDSARPARAARSGSVRRSSRPQSRRAGSRMV